MNKASMKHRVVNIALALTLCGGLFASLPMTAFGDGRYEQIYAYYTVDDKESINAFLLALAQDGTFSITLQNPAGVTKEFKSSNGYEIGRASSAINESSYDPDSLKFVIRAGDNTPDYQAYIDFLSSSGRYKIISVPMPVGYELTYGDTFESHSTTDFGVHIQLKKSNSASAATSSTSTTPTTGNDDFIIEDGVMYGYKGKGGNIVIPQGVKTLFSITNRELGVTYSGNDNPLVSGVTLPKSLVKLERSVFDGAVSLKRVTIQPNTIKEIPEYAFRGSGIESIVIPQGVTTIGQCAFEDCATLTSVTIAESVTTIDPFIFSEGNKSKITIYGVSGSYAETFAKKYGIKFAPTPAPVSEQILTAKPTSSTVLVNGKDVAFDAYNINGNNYFKLRDLAYALNGSAKQFDVSWDGANNAISLTSGKAYTAAGGEMTKGSGGDKVPSPTSSKILLDGKEATFTAYNIDGSNYFMLRDIGKTFDFGVDWDGAKDTIVIDTSKGYIAK